MFERQERVAPLLGRALRLILDSQSANGMGAWRYQPDSKDADISVTGWCLMDKILKKAGVPEKESCCCSAKPE